MEWFVGGIVMAVVIETVIRVCSNYEHEPEKEQQRIQVSVPWYGWSLLGLLTWRSFRDKGKN